MTIQVKMTHIINQAPITAITESENTVFMNHLIKAGFDIFYSKTAVSRPI